MCIGWLAASPPHSPPQKLEATNMKLEATNMKLEAKLEATNKKLAALEAAVMALTRN